MSGVVVDSSVAIAWLMPDEEPDFVLATQENDAFLDCVAPPLFWFELRNVLLQNERRNRLTPATRVDRPLVPSDAVNVALMTSSV